MKLAEVRVPVPIERAFSVFVEQMETWWPEANRTGAQPFQTIFIEPRAGGRWYERDARGSASDWGQVIEWDPPRRVALSFRGAGKLEVRFSAHDSFTLVQIEPCDTYHAKSNWVLHAGAVPLHVPPALMQFEWADILAEFARVAR